MEVTDSALQSREPEQVPLLEFKVHFFWILIALFCPVLLATTIYSVSSDSCAFLNVFRSGKLPGSPQSNAAAFIFLLGAIYICVGALQFDFAFWKFESWSIVIPEFLKVKKNIFGLVFGDISARIRVFFIYPTISFFCTYMLLLILHC